MQFSTLNQSVFFRLITKIVLISYLHAVFYPIYADETLDRQAELAKRKAAYSIKIETLGSEDGAGIQTDGQESPQAPRAIRLTIKDRQHLQDKRAALKGDQNDSSLSRTSEHGQDYQNLTDTDVTTQVFTITSGNLSRFRDITEAYDKVTGLSKGISWDIDGYHRLFIGWDGASTLQGGLDDDDQTVSSSTGLAFEKSPPITIESLKIKTEHTVAVKNALAKFLKVSNQSAVVVEGQTDIETFDVKSKPRSGTQSGLHIDARSHFTTKTLRMLAGKLTNYGKLDLAEGATVTFSGNTESDLINRGTITGSGKASFQKIRRTTNKDKGLINLPQLTLDTKELTQQGEIKGQEVTLNVTERLTNTGKVTADDTLILNLSDNAEVRNTGTMAGDKATVKGSGTLENLGLFNFKTIDAARTAITQRGLLKATESLTLRNATLSNLGATQTKELDLKGSSTLINGDSETKGAQLSVSAQLSMEEQSQLINHGKASIEKITGEGTTLLNEGEFEAKDIDARITNFTNREQMNVRGHLHLQDSTLENDGTLTVKNITMQRGKLHNKQAGDITVQDAGALTLSSFVNDGDWTSEKGFRLTLTDAGDQKGTLRQNGTMTLTGDSEITGHLFHNTKKFVAKGKLTLDLYDLLNDKTLWIGESNLLIKHQFLNHHHFVFQKGNNRFYHGINTGLIECVEHLPTASPTITPYRGIVDKTYHFGRFDNYGKVTSSWQNGGVGLTNLDRMTNKGQIQGNVVQVHSQHVINTANASITAKQLDAQAKTMQNMGKVEATEKSKLHIDTLVNTTTGQFYAKDVKAVPQNITSRGKMHLDGVKGDQTIQSLNVRKATTQPGQVARTSEFTIENPENLTLKKVVVDQDSKLFFKKGKVKVESFEGKATSATTLFENTDATFTGSFYQDGFFDSRTTALSFDLEYLQNAVNGKLYAQGLSKTPRYIFNHGEMLLKGIKGQQNIAYISNEGAAAKLTFENPDDLTLENTKNEGNLTLNKGKVTVNHLTTTADSTTTVLADTNASFMRTFDNAGTFESASSLSFDWSKDNLQRGTIRLGKLTFTAPVTFNLRGWEKANNILDLQHFLRNNDLRFSTWVKILADGFTVDQDFTFAGLLDLDLTGNFHIQNALFKLLGLKVKAQGNIGFAKPAEVYQEFKDRWGNVVQRNFIRYESWSDIETEQDLSLQARNIDAQYARVRSGKKADMKADDQIMIGASMTTQEFAWNGQSEQKLFPQKKNMGSYIVARESINLDAKRLLVKFGLIKSFSNVTLTGREFISHVGSETLSGGKILLKTPEFYLRRLENIRYGGPLVEKYGIKYYLVLMSHGLEFLPNNSGLSAVGNIEFEGTNFYNYVSDVTCGGRFILPEVTKYVETSEQIVNFCFFTPNNTPWAYRYHTDTSVGPNVQTGKEVTIQCSEIAHLTGRHSAGGDISLTGNGALRVDNLSHYRATYDTSKPFTIPLTSLMVDSAARATDPTLGLNNQGVIVPVLPASRKYQALRIPSVGPIPTGPSIDPLINADMADLALFAQKSFKNTTGLQLDLQAMIENTLALGVQNLSYEEINDLDRSIAYYSFTEKNGVTYKLLNLHIAPEDQNPYQSNGDMYANGSIKAITKGDQTHRSNRMVARKSLTAQSTAGKMNRITTKYATYQSDSKNFSMQEHADPTQTMASLEEDVTATSREEYFEEGVDTLAALDLKRGSTHAKTTSKHLELMSYSSSSSKRRSESITNYSHKPSQAIAGQDSSTNAGKGTSLNIIGSTTHADRDNTLEVEDGVINVEAAASVNEHKSSSTKSSAFGSISSSSTQQSAVITPAGFSAGRKGKLSADKANVTGGHIKVKVLDNATKKGITAQPKVVDTVSTTESSGKGSLGSFHASSTTFKQYGTDTIIEAEQIITPNSKITITAINPDQFWGENGKPEIIGEIGEIQKYILKEWTTSTASYSGIYDPKIGAFMSLAISAAAGFLTAGAGFGAGNIAGAFMKAGMPSFMAKMVGAGVNIAAKQLIGCAIQQAGRGGNPLDAIKMVGSGKQLRQIAAAAVWAGVDDALVQKLKLEVAPENDFMENLGIEMRKAPLKAVVDAAVGGEKLGDALKNNAINAVGKAGAMKIGNMYRGEKPILNYFTHKTAHGFLGAVLGYAKTGKAKGALNGAGAAIVAEVVAEEIMGDIDAKVSAIYAEAANTGTPLTPQAFREKYSAAVREDFAAEAGKLAAGFAALVANQDVNLAAEVGDNAVQNNFIPAALFVGFMAYEGYQIYKTYQEEGAAAAALQLGFTVGEAMIGGVLVKNAFRFGGIAVRTAEEAILAYKAEFPMFGRFYDLAATAYQRGAAVVQNVAARAEGVVQRAVQRVTPRSVWQEGPVVRGELIEQQLGQNLHKNFPTIDRFEDGIATSIKSIDLHAPTYQNLNKLNNKVRKYIDKVANFRSGTLLDNVIEAHEVRGRALDLVIPYGAHSTQKQILQLAKEYAQSKNVNLNIIKMR